MRTGKECPPPPDESGQFERVYSQFQFVKQTKRNRTDQTHSCGVVVVVVVVITHSLAHKSTLVEMDSNNSMPAVTSAAATVDKHRCIISRISQSRGRRWNVRNILVATLFLSLFIGLLSPNPNDRQLVEGAKLKKEAKKALISLAKGFVVNKLTTRKNFMPLPVPIPGKWQQILTAAFDSGLLLASKSKLNSDHHQQQQQKFNPGSSKKYGSATSIGTDSWSVSKFLASKLLRAAAAGSSGSGSSSTNLDGIKDKNQNEQKTGGKSFNLKRVEKQVRITAAKYAGKIIAQQLPNKNSMLPGGSAAPSSGAASKLSRRLFPGLADRKSTDSSASSTNQHNTAGTPIKQNDLLVTAYNLVKFIQQFRELDRTKLLDLNKMSLGNLVAASSQSNSNKVPPIIAMNINNKKTLMNKLNYMHNLSNTLNYLGHRRDHIVDLATTH